MNEVVAFLIVNKHYIQFEMNFTYVVVHMLNCKHDMQLESDASTSFPALYGANKVRCSFF